MVQTGTFLGLVVASAINVGTNYLVWGWRLSLGLAAVPGAILLLGKRCRRRCLLSLLHCHAIGTIATTGLDSKACKDHHHQVFVRALHGLMYVGSLIVPFQVVRASYL